jgi:hypothetical protein
MLLCILSIITFCLVIKFIFFCRLRKVLALILKIYIYYFLLDLGRGADDSAWIKFVSRVNAQLRNKLHSECVTLCLYFDMLSIYVKYMLSLKTSSASYILAYVIISMPWNHRKMNFAGVKMWMYCFPMLVKFILWLTLSFTFIFLFPYYMLGSAW